MVTVSIEMDEGFPSPIGNPFNVAMSDNHVNIGSTGVVFFCPFRIFIPYGFEIRVESLFDDVIVSGWKLRKDGRVVINSVIISEGEQFDINSEIESGNPIFSVFVERILERPIVRFSERRGGMRVISGPPMNIGSDGEGSS